MLIIIGLVILIILCFFISKMFSDHNHQKEINHREEILKNQKDGLKFK